MVENEKKFLVKELPSLDGVSYNFIEQGYISSVPEVRIRMKGNRYFLTRKSEGDQVREEYETEINHDAYAILKVLVQGRVITKTRYEVVLDLGIVAELDVYHGEFEGLVTVETEFKSEEQVRGFVIPEWFGKEITNDKRYKNKYLASSLDIQEVLGEI